MLKNLKRFIRCVSVAALTAALVTPTAPQIHTVYAAEASNYTMSVKTDKKGNIFTGKTFTFKLSLTNSANSTFAGNLNYTIYGEDTKNDKQGTVVKSGTKAVSLIPGILPTEVIIEDTLDKYGVYSIDFALTDSSGGTLCSSQSEFSLITPTKQNPKMGFSQHVLGHGIGTKENTSYFSDILGMGVVRDDYPAVFMYDTSNGTLKPETVNGKKYWGWDRIDSFTDEMNDHNIEPLAIIDIGGDGVMDKISGVTWPVDQTAAETEAAQEQLYKYCYDLVSRLKGRCEIFEVFNEYNLYKESNPEINEKAYALCLKTAAKAIKDANPKAQVVAMCTQNDVWVENVLKELGTNPGQYFDAISIHPYVYWKNTYPEQDDVVNGWDTQSNKTDLRAFKRMLAKYGVADKPLYATEYGITLHLSNYQELNQHTLAAHLIRSTIINSEFADKNYVYTLYKKSNTKMPKEKWTDGYSSARKERGFGVLRYIERYPIISAEDAEKYTVENLEDWQEPMAALPSAVALAAFNNVMNNAEYVSDSIIRSYTDNTVYDYQYSTADGQVCAVWDITADKKFGDAREKQIWNIRSNDEYLYSSRDINIHIDAKQVTVYDMYGNSEVKTSPKGNYKITIGKEPIYIKADTMSGLKEISDEQMSQEEKDGYVLPYTSSDWRMIFKNKSDNIGKQYKEGDGFGKETNAGKFFIFEMWN